MVGVDIEWRWDRFGDDEHRADDIEGTIDWWLRHVAGCSLPTTFNQIIIPKGGSSLSRMSDTQQTISPPYHPPD